MKIFLVILFCSSLSSQRVLGFGISAGAINMKRRSTSLSVWGRTDEEDKLSSSWPSHIGQTIQRALAVVTVAATVWTGGLTQLPPTALAAQDPNQIVACLFQKCSKPLGQCVLNPKCLANVVCLNTCGDDINCQIKCGDLFENCKRLSGRLRESTTIGTSISLTQTVLYTSFCSCRWRFQQVRRVRHGLHPAKAG